MDASYTIIWLEFSEKRPEFQYFPRSIRFNFHSLKQPGFRFIHDSNWMIQKWIHQHTSHAKTYNPHQDIQQIQKQLATDAYATGNVKINSLPHPKMKAKNKKKLCLVKINWIL